MANHVLIIFIVLGYFMVIIANPAQKIMKLPPGFTKCPRNTEEFKKCSIKAATESIPFLLRGNKNLGIPPLNPLKLPLIRLQASKNLELNMTDATILGLNGTRVVKANSNFEKKLMELSLNIAELVIQGTYVIDGKVLFLPIIGKGPAAIKAFDGYFNYSFNYDLFKKNGLEYAKMTTYDFKFQVGMASFKMEGLFNGDETLGGEMNKFLNENWKEVLNDFGEFIGNTVSGLIKRLADKLLDNVPFDEFFSH